MREIVQQQRLARLNGLIQRGAALNGSPFHEPPLMLAVSAGWTAGVRALLAAGVDVHASFRQTLPLNIATIQHRPDLITLLISAGADPNRRPLSGNNDVQNTALHEAFAVKPMVKLVKLLLAAGADPNARSKFGRTPLSLALDRSDSPTLIQMLVSAGANPTVPDADGQTPTDVLNARSRVPDRVRQALDEAIRAHVDREQQVLRDLIAAPAEPTDKPGGPSRPRPRL